MAFEQFLATMPIGISQSDLTAPVSRPSSGPVPRRENLGLTRPSGDANGEDEVEFVLPTARPKVATVGRNDPCPCGSGKKFKHCHGRVA
jgi:preprotein translocase subunit SecA